MTSNFPRWFIFGSFLFIFSTTLHAGQALVGHTGLAGKTLDAADIRAVLLGKKIMLGGTRVVIVIARDGDAQNAFLQASVGMSTSQFQNYWRRLFMTGGGSAPKIVGTETDARKLATQIPGAIVIVDSANAAGLVLLATH